MKRYMIEDSRYEKKDCNVIANSWSRTEYAATKEELKEEFVSLSKELAWGYAQEHELTWGLLITEEEYRVEDDEVIVEESTVVDEFNYQKFLESFTEEERERIEDNDFDYFNDIYDIWERRI